MGYALEVECVAAAHRLGLLTTPYVFDPQQAHDMTRAGADILVAHMGLTTGGAIGAESALTLEQCVERVSEIAAAGRQVRSDVLVLCHGGPIAMPDDAQYILDHCDIHGFYGASSMERLPTEVAIRTQVADFARLHLR